MFTLPTSHTTRQERITAPPQKTAVVQAGFTLVELLVSAVIVVLIMALLSSMVNSTSSVWTRSRAPVEQFQQAREAFDSLIRRPGCPPTGNTYAEAVPALALASASANSAT